ncbi:helix-turn-helix transcriptional regulator [Dolichospermum circinale]|uniref:helix-turn-helix transcriptional regulator n=1 Tax=Dolichospermum circinale TaxID=109265 RepID=UPI001E350D65|nr:helix-turn-helix transcriptional regulator [Dolichospermum circinale]MDB9473980.1 helix-turn-helix transcriptional regulator [Dolichospermum circinale CS-537/11]MDB9477993.1 helix-turn-helix transcriptional regulator [Dolichospermum circinale CS-537/03]
MTILLIFHIRLTDRGQETRISKYCFIISDLFYKGKIEKLQYDSLEKLPEALIKARIIRGHTQESFAKLLGVKPQQVQRDEANGYASASLTKLLKIQHTLNLEIREEIIFK